MSSISRLLTAVRSTPHFSGTGAASVLGGSEVALLPAASERAAGDELEADTTWCRRSLCAFSSLRASSLVARGSAASTVARGCRYVARAH